MKPSKNYLKIQGMKFGRLTVIERIGKDRHNKFLWLCKCQCGKKCIVIGSNLKRGNTKSCGCLFLERSSIANTKHGFTGTKIYRTWKAIKMRCNNPKVTYFKHYGGRGVKVCERWLKSFKNFLADMGLPPSPLHSIERIDNNGHYEPNNCKWATPKEQRNNRRDNHRVKITDAA